MKFEIQKSYIREKLFGWRYKPNTKYWWIWQLKKNGCETTSSPGSNKSVKRMLCSQQRVIWVDKDDIWFRTKNDWESFKYEHTDLETIIKFIRSW